MSEPQRLGEILPEVMCNIKRRMESRRPGLFNNEKQRQRRRVLCAAGDFVKSKRR